MRQVDDTWITVNAADLSQLLYVGGVSPGSESVDVAAWDGYNWSYFQTATVTTNAVSLPVITVQNESVDENASISAASLIASVSDPNGYAITYYDFRDDGGTGGYFALNGVKQADNVFITVTAANLSQLRYVGGTTPGNELVDVAAWDGYNWSYYQTAVVTTKAVLPSIVTLNEETVNVNASISASSLILSVFDPNNNSPTAYQFRDDGNSGGYFTLNGVKQAANTWINVSAANLPQLSYVGAASAGTDTIEVEVFNGQVWSSDTTTTIITKANNSTHTPVVAVNDPTITISQSIQAATLIASFTDPNDLAPVDYGFLDQGQQNGYLILNGVKQVSGSWITVSAADLSQLLYVGATVAGNDSVDVAVWDGQSWSSTAIATITTAEPDVQHPILVAQDETVASGGMIAASSVIASVTDPNGYSITYYDFRDDGGGAGYFTLNGGTQPSGSWITISAANLANLVYVGGTTAGNETVDVAAWDGVSWSYYQTVAISTESISPPVMTLQNQTVNTGATLQASLFVKSVSDSGGNSITSYAFRDDGGDGGYFTLNGVKQADNAWIAVSAANLSELVYNGPSAAGSEQVDVTVSDGHLTSSVVSATISTQGTLPSNSVIALLQNPGIKADATKYIVNNTLTYSGMLTILQDVAAQGAVTQQELTDLTTLVSYIDKSGGIQVSPYLAYISNALVDGNSANDYWTGGSTSPVTLGNLVAGSSQTQLDDLIGKWFLGTDLPGPIFENSTVGDYVSDTNPLFNTTGVPSVSDVNQGYLGDCYLLASCAEVAQDDPAVIESMFINDGGGVYGVRFYINGSPVYVTVNSELPVYPGTNQLIGESGADIWASLVEKAYVELNAQPGLLDHTAGNEYVLIDGGGADPITELTGKPVTYYYTGQYSATSWSSLKNTIVAAIQNGEEVDFASYGNTTISGETAFVSDHMYSGIGYDSATGDFIVRNPWGVVPGQTWLTEFEATMSDLYTVGGSSGYLAVAQGVSTNTFGAAVPGTQTALTISGTVADQAVADDSTIAPFATVTITDPTVGTTDTVTITLSDPQFGVLSNLGGGTYNSTTGVYTVSGAPGAVTTAIDGLVLTPAAPAANVYVTSTTLTVGVVGPGGGPAASTALTASVQQILGLATVPSGQLAISVSADGTGLATPVSGETNEAVVTSPTGGGTYTLPTGYQAEFLGGTANATLQDTGVGGAVLVGNTGNDLLSTFAAHDTIQAGSGETTVTLGGAFGRARGGTGSFIVDDPTANGTVIGGTADTMYVTVGAAASSSDVFGRAGNTNIIDLGADALLGAGGGTSVVSIGGAGTQLYGASPAGGTLNVNIGAANALVFGLGDNATVDASSAAATSALVYGGFSSIAADNGSLLVQAGADSLVAVTGGSNATVNAGSGDLYTFIGTGTIASGSNLINGASASARVHVSAFVCGGAGSATVVGGEAAASVFGVDGTDATYVNTRAGAPGAFLFAAAGSSAGGETLNAAGSTTNDSLFAAQGNVSLVAGSGTDLLDAGANTGSLGGAGTVVGGDTMVAGIAGSGADLMLFTHGAFAGGAVVINFSSADTIFLSGYNAAAGGDQANMALADATTAGGDTTVALADGTTITFVDTTTAQLQGHMFSN